MIPETIYSRLDRRQREFINKFFSQCPQTLSAGMMLRYSFGLIQEADDIERAVTAVLAQGYRTPDIYTAGMKQIGTQEIGQLIRSALTE